MEQDSTWLCLVLVFVLLSKEKLFIKNGAGEIRRRFFLPQLFVPLRILSKTDAILGAFEK